MAKKLMLDVEPKTELPITPKKSSKSDKAVKLLDNLYADMTSINVRSRGIKVETHTKWVREFEVALNLLKEDQED